MVRESCASQDSIKPVRIDQRPASAMCGRLWRQCRSQADLTSKLVGFPRHARAAGFELTPKKTSSELVTRFASIYAPKICPQRLTNHHSRARRAITAMDNKRAKIAARSSKKSRSRVEPWDSCEIWVGNASESIYIACTSFS